ncbi:RPM1-interacting protein 4-like isoform X2 [Impatiens glandulifera]|uniref:RPM1-interacting protein 4-like isoform X2 n=1 Tax=Impatiens glandulifera TaxID=253017 RepID=UPI001FB0AFE1|nr:RPM1-interacting protein 4-like isoform X2 [Impatiens glandulifera]
MIMQQRAHVPKFGEWGSEEPYTVFFDTARKGRGGGKIINPNDPQEYPDMFPNISSQDSPPRPRPRPESEEPPTYKQPPPPTRQNNDRNNDENMNRRPNPGQVNRNRRSSGSDLSFEPSSSPLYPNYQAKLQTKGSGASPAREGRSSHNSSHGINQGRNRSGKGNNNVPDKGMAIPKFGAWNDENPTADNYTYIFKNAQNERHAVPENSASNAPAYSNTRYQAASHEDDHTKICCFPWCKK